MRRRTEYIGVFGLCGCVGDFLTSFVNSRYDHSGGDGGTQVIGAGGINQFGGDVRADRVSECGGSVSGVGFLGSLWVDVHKDNRETSQQFVRVAEDGDFTSHARRSDIVGFCDGIGDFIFN